MQFFKALGLFLLLLWSSTGPAFVSPIVEDHFEENLVTFQVSEDYGELPFSTLTKPSFNSARNFCSGINQYVFYSNNETGEAKKYLLIARSIDPGLGVPEIIFPFHTFL